jgi:hypothetical protein
VRVLKLITLLLLALVASLARPHLHTGAAASDGSVCAKCQVRNSPAELGELPADGLVSLVSFVAPRERVLPLVESARCLDRAPKQGPPAA